MTHPPSNPPGINTRACAHRGDSKNAPENTLPAFLSAVDKGAHQIEFDVYLSKDGRAVVIHDATADRTTNGAGRVCELSYEELRALDAGSWFGPAFSGALIPTLEEALDVIPPPIRINVQLKDSPGVAAAAAQTIVDMGKLEQCFLACSKEDAAIARKIAPDITICNMSGQYGPRDEYVRRTIELRAGYIQLVKDVDGLKEAVDVLHANGIVVNYFEAHEPAKIRQCIEAGVDFILTDDLDVCLSVLAEYGVQPVETPARKHPRD